MCVIKVYILCLFFIGSLVHAYINNEESTPYKQKASYINHRLNNRNSYQYLSHRLRHNNRYFNINNNNYNHKNTNNNNNNYNIEVKTENPFRRLYATTTTEKQIVNVQHQDEDVFEETDGKPDDTIKNYEAEDDEEEDEDDDDEEEDYDASEAEDWQAEEATEEPTERTITEYKWKHFGTRSRVEESRKNSNTLPAGVHQAVAHARKVVQQGACHTPRIRLINIQSVYPDTGKAYIPHCTLLHRCSDETGCCRTDSLTCAPKTTERIELYFYTGRPNNYKVEKLAFYNHTECHCIERPQEVMSGDAALHLVEDRHPIRAPIEAPQSQPQPQHSSTAVTLAEPLKKCHCPELYTPQVSHKTCRCDCLEGNRDCMRIKRGKEYFSLKDRLCIQRQECGNPSCEFGVYIRFAGRCPRKQESITKISTQ